ncbi:unnamed protein product [Tilletia controversa]|uniref:Tyrosinase copper-binding domain-containing protein n=3 Tax=Tilletia TaxID=13289 RepID=A0A8X7MSB7_9BASI|nr:hypothetical protein CF336_g4038 [Tilletia laevis]KAE8197039.1 hypothetical protein CF328_g3966 [Tilletia controversa]KAE8260903.1 hypothetical protein A4X03_0g3667 [Tilletia caries]KAE8202262.1 hypothetical protein CF335_g3487 [Tilletia laevis]KAE8247131.1 hypothetical protein A4X06_0g4679 [Tilletia controversa]
MNLHRSIPSPLGGLLCIFLYAQIHETAALSFDPFDAVDGVGSGFDFGGLSDFDQPGSEIKYDRAFQDYLDSTSGSNGCHSLRPRVEWRDLTDRQRRSWIDANWCLTKKPSVLTSTQTNLTGLHTSLLSDFTLVHIRLFEVIHFVAAFLPWHRWYLIAREIAMRECGYQGPIPYWDWSIDADTGHAASSPVLSDDEGIGGDGSRSGVLTTGPFAYFPNEYISETNEASNLSIPLYRPHHLNRTFGSGLARNRTFPLSEDAFNTTFTQKVLLTNNDYRSFQPNLEGLEGRVDIDGMGPHSVIHRAFGGDMQLPHSPNDPVFFLHHANVDRLWWLWQKGLSLKDTRRFKSTVSERVKTTDRRRLYDYGGNTMTLSVDRTGGPRASLNDVQSILGLYLPNIATYKLMDISRPPLCYTYI